MVTLDSIIRQIGALQRAGARVESITLHPDDADRIELAMKENPNSADALDNQLGRLVYGNARQARFWFYGFPVLTSETMERGSVSISWSEQ